VASNPNVPVELKRTNRDAGMVPLVIVIIDTVLEAPEQTPLVTVEKRR
jgi:hypothetical protein